jgi:hypothetical protein
VIGIDGKHYLAHRLAWLYVHGLWPAIEVDHWDRNRKNNRMGNLREATRSENMRNVGKTVANKSGAKGVSWSQERKKWVASIQHNKRTIALGRYETIEAAKAAYDAAALKLHGEFARTE